jgi:hypothetical protein
MQLAQANQAQVGKVGVAIGITLGQGGELLQVLATVEGQGDQAVLDLAVARTRQAFRQYDRLTILYYPRP